MTEVAPPTPPTPKAAAKGLKGKLTGRSKWVYVAMAVGVIGVAYLIHRRNQAAQADQAIDPNAAPAPDVTLPPDTASYAAPGVVAGQTDGAFGGYPDPGISDNGSIPDNSVPATPPAIINVYGATPATSDGATPAQVDTPVPPDPVPAPTGGGLPTRSIAVHALPPKTVVRPSAAHGGDLGVYHYTDTDPSKPGYERKVFVRKAKAAIKKATTPKQKKSAKTTPAPHHTAASHTKAKKKKH